MPFAFSPFRKANPGWLMVLAALAVGFAAPARADVQTYTNQAIPVLPPAGAGYYDTPLKAGQLTMQEVLETHPKTKPPSAPPLLSAPANSSAESIMLMQGMQNALQEAPPAGAIPRLRAPHMNGAIAGEPAVPPIEESQLFGNAATAAPTPLEPGVKYQPGQAPKNLAGEIQKTENAAIPEATALQSQPAPLAASSAGTSSSATAAAGGCEAHIQNWDKSCAEAGYPATYVGKVVGETRTECPSGTLQDVWVQNTCMPPENGPAVAATAEAMTKAQLAASAPPAHASSASEVSPSAMASASAAAAPPIPAALAAPPTAAAPITREDGNCGSANGLASIVKPFGDLCMAGQPTPVTGAGPWRWSCQGMAGGMTVSCAAPLSSQSAAAAAATTGNPAMTASPVPSPTPEDGRCGAANDTGSVQAPAAELCAGGIASAVSGAGPWTWACSGLNGGQAAACRAPRIVSGACGTAISQATDHMPAADLCAEGYAGAVTGQGPWNWTCSGLYGGPAAVCSVAPKKDAVCGTASLSGHHQAPINDLCSIGEASAVTGSGPWTWGCAGVNGGAAVSCTADASLNGMCGAANGVAAGEAPRGDLCAEGKPTRVTGAGPWSWNCEGVAGGETQGCVAPMAVPEPTLKSSPSAQPVVGSAPVGHAEQNTTSSAELSSVPPSMAPAAAPKPAAKTEITWNKPAAAPQETTVACGIASEAVAFVAPSKNLCRKGAAGDVTGKGPWKWACTDKDGYAVDCATLGPSNGTCGAAGDVASAREPASGLCAAGSAGSVTAGKDMWTWTCAGTLGGTSAYCMAPMTAAMKSAAPAKKAAKTSSPSSHTAVLSGPPPVAAPQAKPAPPPITHPACGDAAGRGALSAPRHEDLCAVGEASHVKGRGPWHWTCYRHRAHVACEAPRQMDGACGSANGATLKVAPFRHLCRSGKPTEVAGAGPWLWSCVGEGGGNSASCSALSQAQTRVEGACGAAANTPVHNAP
ncbi:MAG TPA: hypothetical protein VMV79_00820, partial [Alphaproteobacteria bacterium]|nr:hypothetical protein [Alphaproteobacteria bacterium]